INPVSLTNVEGDPIYGYDGYRRTFNLAFSDSYVSNNNASKCETLQRDTGLKRFYPLGDDTGTTLFMDGCTEEAITSGSFNNSTMVLTPTGLSSNNAMIPQHWAGFWVYCDDTVHAGYLLIASNIASSMTLEDPLGIGLNSGTITFYIDHILVKTDLDPLSISQQNFTHFLRGGAWREIDRDTTAPFEYTGWSINFHETRRLVRG